MSILVCGLGAAGCKCANDAVKAGVISVEDTILINSTSKDFPEDFTGRKITISPVGNGAGKEREISKAYTVNAIKGGLFNLENIDKYSTVCLVTSVEGGTGSGATPLLAQYFSKVFVKNVWVFALTSFGEDVRSLSNSVEFFKEIKDNVIVHTISNSAFLQAAEGNKSRAEELANQEFVKRFRVISGKELIPGAQNIDDTDIIKLTNTYGYTTVEYKELDKPFGESSDYDKLIKNMIYERKSLKSICPAATKMGVILNLSDQSADVLADVFSTLKESYGIPYECFKHIQYDGKKEYVAFIVAGMKLPIDELQKIYDQYIEQTKLINKDNDEFFDTMKNMSLLEEDKKFDMIKPVKKGMSTEDFLSNL